MKQYHCEYYQVTYSGEEKTSRKEQFLGRLTFFHAYNPEHPVERKAFQIAPSNFMTANKLIITEVR